MTCLVEHLELSQKVCVLTDLDHLISVDVRDVLPDRVLDIFDFTIAQEAVLRPFKRNEDDVSKYLEQDVDLILAFFYIFLLNQGCVQACVAEVDLCADRDKAAQALEVELEAMFLELESLVEVCDPRKAYDHNDKEDEH